MTSQTILLISIALLSSAAGANSSCPKPNPDASGLFALIADPSTPPSAVTAFLQSHVVAWDSLNETCENTVTAAIDDRRTDLFDVLYNQYRPDLVTTMPGSKDSVYTYAIEHGTLDFVKQVTPLAYPAGVPTYLTDDRSTPLMLAAASNTVDVVNYYLALIPSAVNWVGQNEETPLFAAASTNPSGDVINALLDFKADVNLGDRIHRAPLEIAALQNNADVVRALIRRGAEINAADANGETALMAAASRSDSAAATIIHVLIQAGASVNVTDRSDSNTALMYAAKSGTADTIRFLIQAGANLSARTYTSNGYLTALGIAKRAKRPQEIIELLGG